MATNQEETALVRVVHNPEADLVLGRSRYAPLGSSLYSYKGEADPGINDSEMGRNIHKSLCLRIFPTYPTPFDTPDLSC